MKTGYYKFEVWGAQGGMSKCNGTADDNGGKGGYSSGYKRITAGSSIYIIVGGKGETAIEKGQAAGGYNGGGGGDNDHQDDEASGGGGGATHIATNYRGELKNYSSNKSEVLIVAGGGASLGSGYNCGSGKYIAGYGGGESGGSGTYYYVDESGIGIRETLDGATQTSGYAFGLGQSASEFAVAKNQERGAGGGGYYGGYATPSPTVINSGPRGGGSGGSGYIGGVTNSQIIAGNASMPSPTSSSDETGHAGDGYARITYVGTSI